MYLLADINTKQSCNAPEEKYFAPLKILYLFTKSSADAFVHISLTFFNSLFNSFSASTCFVLFKVFFLLRFFSLSSKPVFFTKSATSALVANFASFNLAANFSFDNLLNS